MTILIFFIVLSVLVLAHEWGHFITAKRAGAKVEEFGFGFPPKIFSFTRNGTIFSINLIPFGGFVKIYGENGLEARNEPGSFTSLKIARRAKIVAAGVAMNVVLAFILLSIVNLVGKPSIVDEDNAAMARDVKIQVVDVADNSPASNAGIKAGDVIKSFTDVSNFKTFVEGSAGHEIVLFVKRGLADLEIKATPRTDPPADEGALGVSLIKT
ncbi:MAG: site-2 protease family protein, partial [Patescibacteria group bacterium]